jgi:2-polyprenyl-3-methyl-5-hydroxy-6-metoxy-1,4-benzoquinol methylase
MFTLKIKYLLRIFREKLVYNNIAQVHDLPPIFHYWSNKYLRPIFENFGYSNPDDFFIQETLTKARVTEDLMVLSVGAGNCDQEIALAKKLAEEGLAGHIHCLDINSKMLKRGEQKALAENVNEMLTYEIADFNKTLLPARQFDVVLANQCLHHVLELEHLFENIHAALKPGGIFLISDMIGRNGHLRWPEARAELEPFWQELPASYRYNRCLNRQEDIFQDHDCSQKSFEGIRAQEILPLLIKCFQFELFIPFGNIIYPFVDRCFGPNFNASAAWDRDFIDRVQAHDEQCIKTGRLKPTALLAVVQRRDEPDVQVRLVDPVLTPEFSVRYP